MGGLKESSRIKELKAIIQTQNDELKRLEELSYQLEVKMVNMKKFEHLKKYSTSPYQEEEEENSFDDHLSEKLEGILSKINSIKTLMKDEKKEIVLENGMLRNENQQLRNKQGLEKEMKEARMMILPRGTQRCLNIYILKSMNILYK